VQVKVQVREDELRELSIFLSFPINFHVLSSLFRMLFTNILWFRSESDAREKKRTKKELKSSSHFTIKEAAEPNQIFSCRLVFKASASKKGSKQRKQAK